MLNLEGESPEQSGLSHCWASDFLLFLKPHAGPAVAGIARIEENNTRAVERFLNCGESTGARIGPPPLQVFYSHLGETGRPGQLDLRPIEQPTGRAYLSARNHSETIGEDDRNNNYRLRYVSFSLDSLVCGSTEKGHHRSPKISMSKGLHARSAPDALLPAMRR